MISVYILFYISFYAAYTTDEVDEKTKALRASPNFDVPDDASSLDVSLPSCICAVQ